MTLLEFVDKHPIWTFFAMVWIGLVVCEVSSQVGRGLSYFRRR